MKNLIPLVVVLSIILISCNDSNSSHFNKKSANESDNKPLKKLKVSDDTLMQGDIFMTSGPAGAMDQKQGKIVLIADSGKAMPVILKNDKLMAIELTGSGSYRIEKNGDQISYTEFNTDSVLGNGDLMFLTDDGEILNVRLLGDRLVILTKNNLMIPLVKK